MDKYKQQQEAPKPEKKSSNNGIIVISLIMVAIIAWLLFNTRWNNLDFGGSRQRQTERGYR